MTDRIISDREAGLLRERIAFIVRDGGYRVVCTDSESPDGILPRCTSPAHPESDREQQWDVLDCCQTEDGYRLIETGHEYVASVWVDSLYVIPALLDEREQLRTQLTAALEATAKAVGMLSDTYRERAFLVALLAAEYPSAWVPDESAGPDWRVVYLELPTGQASWHISPDDWDLFGFVPQGDAGIWDGHTTVEKYKRIHDLTMSIHLRKMTADEQPAAEQDGAAARIAELERELLALRGTELNPSPTILDAQSYRELADEIAATMTDDWDGEDSEPYILIQYVRWLAAGQPRDEDGYPIRRETYPAPEAVQAEPRPGHGPGVPGAMHLEAFGQSIADAFGECPYHVGSSATSKTWRDVDVRLILDDDRFHALFPGFRAANHIDAWWSLFCAAMSELGRARTGLPIDFQVQSKTEANEKYHGIRNPLFLIYAKDDHRPTMRAAAPTARDADGSAS